MVEYGQREIKKENGIFEYINKFCTRRGDYKALYLNLRMLQDTPYMQQNRYI